jgi:hypothetical protein
VNPFGYAALAAHLKLDPFETLDQQRQDDLTNWFNSSKPDIEDKARLYALHVGGRFHAWDCFNCGDRCFVGFPDSVDGFVFHGCLQPDFTSYPGDPDVWRKKAKAREQDVHEFMAKLCDHCRAFGP